MALATTSALWRSTGGDSTRTAYAGSMHMAAQFYIANTAATSNVVVSSASNAAALVLPAAAVITDVIITTGPGGNSAANIGYTPLKTYGPGQAVTLGTNVPNGVLNSANVSTRITISVGSTGQGTQLGNVANATNLILLTSAQGATGAAAGAVTGIIQYYVADNGQQNV